MRLRATGWRSPAIRHTLTGTTRSGAIRGLSSSNSLARPKRIPLDIPPPFPVTKSCPDSRCSCPPTPPMPEGSPLDYDHPLSGTIAAYSQQIVICTGQRDWTSRIEDDGKGKSWGELVRGLKRLMGRGGPYADVSCLSILAMNALLIWLVYSPLTTLWLRIRPYHHPRPSILPPGRPRLSFFPASNTSLPFLSMPRAPHKTAPTCRPSYEHTSSPQNSAR